MIFFEAFTMGFILGGAVMLAVWLITKLMEYFNRE